MVPGLCKSDGKCSCLPVHAGCLARNEASAGWTSLHLSSHCGHKDVVEDLLKVSFVHVCGLLSPI